MLTNDDQADQPFGVGSIAELGPDERAKLDALLDHIYEYGAAAPTVGAAASQAGAILRAEPQK